MSSAAPAPAESSVLQLRNLRIALLAGEGPQEIVKGVDLSLRAGEVSGLAGESGCGKSLTALALLGLHDPGLFRVSCDEATLASSALPLGSARAMRPFRGRDLTMVFQDPAAALDPVFTVGGQLERALARRTGVDRTSARRRSLAALGDVGFPDPARIATRYAHELSGGMRQLCLIAMAKALKPRVLIADEPTTALDAATQELVLKQLLRLAREEGTAVLLITHDLRLLTRYAWEVMVMYHGRIIERISGTRLHSHPAHPYTRGLLNALPRLDGEAGRRAQPIPGTVPAATAALQGCAFAARCELASRTCSLERPELRSDRSLAVDEPVPGGEPAVACHHPLEAGP